MPGDIGRSPADYIKEKIHPTPKIDKKTKKEIVKKGTITQSDGDIVLRFILETSSNAGLNPSTRANHMRYASRLVEMFPDIPSWNNETLNSCVSALRSDKFAANTQRKAIIILKSFCRWLLEENIVSGITEKQLDKIKPTKANLLTKKPDEMITDDEFHKMLSSIKNTRDRCMVAVLYESAMRPNELLSLTWADVKTDDKGAVLTTSGKTGKPRYVRIIRTAEFLKIWKNDYPLTIKGESPVFVSLEKQPYHALTQNTLKKIIKKSAQCLGGKKVFPYLLRHSRITEMMAKGLPDSVIKLQAWGTLSSSMLGTYAHLSNEQQDTFLMAAEGMTTEIKVKSDSALKPMSCPACGVSNQAGLEFCGKCGSVLDPVEYQRVLDGGIGSAKEIAALKDEVSVLSESLSKLMEIMQPEIKSKFKRNALDGAAIVKALSKEK